MEDRRDGIIRGNSGYNGWLTAQLYAGHPIDPDAWQEECFLYMKGVMEHCGVWEN